jgi:hypothetical protein
VFAILDKTAAGHDDGSDVEGKIGSFTGVVQLVENNQTQYPGYPLQITMK